MAQPYICPNTRTTCNWRGCYGGGGLLQALIASQAIREHRQFIGRNISIILLGVVAVGIYPLAFYSSIMLNYDWYAVVSIGSAPLIAAALERFFDRKVLSKTWFLPKFCVGCCGGKFIIYGRKPRSTREYK